MNKVINDILFTRIYVVYDDGVTPETDGWSDFAIELDTVNSFYDVGGGGQKDILQGKIKISTASGEYIVDMTFNEFKDIYLKYRSDSEKPVFFKNNN